MVATCAGGGALVLSPAQRSLVEKSLAVRHAREEKAAIQRTIENASQRHIDDTKERYRTTHRIRDAAERDHSLVIRHVGEQLANVAKREQLQDPHKIAKKVSASKADAFRAGRALHLQPGGNGSGGGSNGDTRSARGNVVEDEYDEDRFGPVRRPPRIRPPNLWVSIFEKEQEDVKREQEEAQRKRHEAAEKYRAELAQQELNKQAQRKQERAVTDSFAQQQAQQIAVWKAQESEKQRKQRDAMVDESKRCQQEFQRTLQQQMAAQKKKEMSELRAVERYNTMFEEEKQEKELKKQQHKQEMALVKQANAMQLELKRKELLREQEEEIKLQKEYEKKLALQEEQRQRELQAILEKQSKKVKLALLNVKSAEEKAREDEERAAIIQAQVCKKEEDELKRRAARKQEVTRVQMQALLQQKAERADKFAREQMDEDAYAKEFKHDFLQWQQKEQSKQVQVRERNRAYQGLVKQQMGLDEARKASEDKYGMSREEMALNAALLKHAGVAQLLQDAQRTRK